MTSASPDPDHTSDHNPDHNPQASPSPASGAGAEVGADKATTALICGSIGLAACAPVGVVAFVMGQKARTEAKQTGRPLDAKMNVAFFMGLASVILLVLLVLIVVISVVAAFVGA